MRTIPNPEKLYSEGIGIEFFIFIEQITANYVPLSVLFLGADQIFPHTVPDKLIIGLPTEFPYSVQEPS